MKWHEFVFGNGQARIKRHLFFWSLGYLYFLGSFFLIQQEWSMQQGLGPLLGIFIKSIPLFGGHVLLTYAILGAMRRWLFERNEIIWFAGTFLASFSALTLFSYYCYRWVFPQVDLFTYHTSPSSAVFPWWSAATAGPLTALKFLLAAMAIKLAKRWYFKEKENIRLRKEKTEAELQLLKAHVNPGFLFRSLEYIHRVAGENPKESAGELLRLSELLSYMLYDTDQEAVQLNKEIGMLKTYIDLERSSMGELVDIAFSVSGKTENKWIAPMLLLPFLENSLGYCNDQRLVKPWISIEVNSTTSVFTMRLLNGKLENQETVKKKEIDLASKRVSILYPGRHELKINVEPDLMMTQLKIEALPSVNGENGNWKPYYNK